MTSKLLIAAILACTAATAGANTYVVKSDNDNSNDAPKLAVSHASKGTCLYADKKVNPGDTIIVEGADTVLVCANAPRGPVFLPLSAESAQRVFSTTPAHSKKPHTVAQEGSLEHTYKVSAPTPPAFTPVKAWDDGSMTYIALSKPYTGELPVVFALAEDGTRALVNFQWDEVNSCLVVQRVLDRAILVLGDKSVVVTRS